MLKIALYLIAALAAIPATAQTSHPFQLVGFTANTLTGGAGALQMSRECWLEYGDGARMCSSIEVLETTALPAQGIPGFAWVRPTFQPTGSTESVDASGRKRHSNSLTCDSWTFSHAQFSGLTVNAAGGFHLETCDVGRPVACCAPVSVLPEPQATLGIAVGAATIVALRPGK